MRWFDGLVILLVAPILVPCYAFWIIVAGEGPQWIDRLALWYIHMTRRGE